ncbi:hypothetical protein QTJ16_000362 [Diplocarpon rosae]|uniref:Uncharacterized protein n=1 Tax=Diplocarpon rosae TaxID=946125 RepID=A0AAD9T671_9HELO|nr:hypothetical protein QTJ16_000362 [Diplocarpon rosae]
MPAVMWRRYPLQPGIRWNCANPVAFVPVHSFSQREGEYVVPPDDIVRWRCLEISRKVIVMKLKNTRCEEKEKNKIKVTSA